VTTVERPVATWVAVAELSELKPDCGVAARVGEAQIAVFRLSNDEVYAIGNLDPISGVNVLSRGIVGDRAGEPKVASPIFKQSFSLRTGVCLDDAAVSVPTYPTRVTAGFVELEVPL
jgi:NAD(P)H-dependent nitrite reductase small subunit